MEGDINPTPEKRKISEFVAEFISKKPRKVFILDEIRSDLYILAIFSRTYCDYNIGCPFKMIN